MIIVVLLLISFVPYGYIRGFMKDRVVSKYAYITIGGEFYKEIPMTGQKERKEIQLETPYGTNTIRIANESIQVVESDCRDHVCEIFGIKSKIGDVIVCLPHQLYIEVRSKEQKASMGEDARGY